MEKYQAYFEIKLNGERYEVEPKYCFANETPLMASKCAGNEKHHGIDYSSAVFVKTDLFKRGGSSHVSAFDERAKTVVKSWTPERRYAMSLERAYDLKTEELLCLLHDIWQAGEQSYLRGDVFLVSPRGNKKLITEFGEHKITLQEVDEWLRNEGIFVPN